MYVWFGLVCCCAVQDDDSDDDDSGFGNGNRTKKVWSTG